ncbi:hypothetical protein E1263_21935 [Kribbella antibiotica]|uniref:Uncharacterized protein n=1 Tax=Kribbella antibiotica TaxID=190195 RepID=A0A4R4ZJ47_9ACTN|nr:hypothetical protein [Kribbella antibiotica]TDD57784.1 hypothetical protein E1263_21935 [Kribbella antibiotica]
MTSYVGSGAYCYANSLAMMVRDVPMTAIEVLTGSPFGAQVEDTGLPWFDPPGWQPDLGLDRAIDLLGWTCTRTSGGSADEALARLRASCPALVGPVDIGLLTHQPWSAGQAVGGDHWVVVTEVTDDVVVFHDPDGFPYATLPIPQFLEAWRADEITSVEGSYILRTDFERHHQVPVEDALRASLPYARDWLSRDSQQAVEQMADRLAAEDDGIRGHLAGLAGPSGVRRLNDASIWLAAIDQHEAATVAADLARQLGSLQFTLTSRQFSRAADILRALAPGYPKLRAVLA